MVIFMIATHVIHVVIWCCKYYIRQKYAASDNKLLFGLHQPMEMCDTVKFTIYGITSLQCRISYPIKMLDIWTG